MKILLIGGSGQDAYYLSKFLTSKGAFVHWIYRGDVSRYQFNIDPSKVVYCNVSSYEFRNVYPLVSRESFDAVVLVAGAVGNQLAKAKLLSNSIQSSLKNDGISPSKPLIKLTQPLRPARARNHLVITHLLPASTGIASCNVNGFGVPSA